MEFKADTKNVSSSANHYMAIYHQVKSNYDILTVGLIALLPLGLIIGIIAKILYDKSKKVGNGLTY